MLRKTTCSHPSPGYSVHESFFFAARLKLARWLRGVTEPWEGQLSSPLDKCAGMSCIVSSSENVQRVTSAMCRSLHSLTGPAPELLAPTPLPTPAFVK